MRHAELWGERERKYAWLGERDVGDTPWQTLAPDSPFYFFRPRDARLAAEYEQGWSLPSAFPANGPCMTTARDHVVIDFTAGPILERAKLFRDSTASDEELCYLLGIPEKMGWDIAAARRMIRQEPDLQKHVKAVLYRPLDERLIFYHDSLVWRTVKQTMRHMFAGYNLGLITTRQTRDQWDVFVTSRVIAHKALAAYDINTLFPLYLYPDTSKPVLLHDEPLPDTPGHRKANLAPAFVADLTTRLGMRWLPDGRGDRRATLGPEDAFAYLYAILHAPSYRERYAEFLKIDFPRVPLTSDGDLFRALCTHGDQLIALHLLEAAAPDAASYPVKGSDRVEGVHYTAPGEGWPEGRVWISTTQYFGGVEPEVWDFHIGGYQVAEKWLKDRKGRTLTYDEQRRYTEIVAALRETIRLMETIDAQIEARGGWPLT